MTPLGVFLLAWLLVGTATALVFGRSAGRADRSVADEAMAYLCEQRPAPGRQERAVVASVGLAVVAAVVVIGVSSLMVGAVDTPRVRTTALPAHDTSTLRPDPPSAADGDHASASGAAVLGSGQLMRAVDVTATTHGPVSLMFIRVGGDAGISTRDAEQAVVDRLRQHLAGMAMSRLPQGGVVVAMFGVSSADAAQEQVQTARKALTQQVLVRGAAVQVLQIGAAVAPAGAQGTTLLSVAEAAARGVREVPSSPNDSDGATPAPSNRSAMTPSAAVSSGTDALAYVGANCQRGLSLI